VNDLRLGRCQSRESRVQGPGCNLYSTLSVNVNANAIHYPNVCCMLYVPRCLNSLRPLWGDMKRNKSKWVLISSRIVSRGPWEKNVHGLLDCGRVFNGSRSNHLRRHWYSQTLGDFRQLVMDLGMQLYEVSINPYHVWEQLTKQGRSLQVLQTSTDLNPQD
jgi:hypothetical protein